MLANMATALLAGLRPTGLISPLVVDGPLSGELFFANARQRLIPALRTSDVVVLESLSRHKQPDAREIIEMAGATLAFLPP